MRLVEKGVEYEITWAKAHNIKDINCPDLKVGAIEVGAIENSQFPGFNPKSTVFILQSFIRPEIQCTRVVYPDKIALSGL